MNRHLLRTAILSLIVLFPVSTFAATLSLTTAPENPGKEFALEVRLNPDGEQLNVVEGTLLVPDDVSVSRVSLGGSALSVWPSQPEYSRESGTISFAGGVAGGALPEGSSLLFTVYVTAPESGEYAFDVKKISTFRADGTGARIEVASVSKEVTVGDGPAVMVAKDITAPNTPVTALGSDASLFEGAPFVSFFATDDGSGVVAYEAKEGWFGKYETAERYYLPKNAYKPVWIRAIDQSGNAKSVHVPGTGVVEYYGLFAIILGILGVVGYLIWRRQKE